MQTWLIEPRDPLIVRDGRPFSADITGARASSLPFPFPSTVAGAIRTRYGRLKGGNFDQALIAEVKHKCIRGPLLVELNEIGEVIDWLLPAPADALWTLNDSDRSAPDLSPLTPLALPDTARTNLRHGLKPVGTTQQLKGKPFNGAPRYWRWNSFKQWLLQPESREKVQVETWGHCGPVIEARVHVGIQPSAEDKPSSLTAIEGALYQTRGLEFTGLSGRPADIRGQLLTEARRLALAVATDADGLSEGLAPLGGERRLAFWRESRNPQVDLFSETDLKQTIVKRILQKRACRLILLTPAHFNEGYLPSWLKTVSPKAGVGLRAVAINRTQVVSGWDFDQRYGSRKEGRPKPTRRLAPAGSVYFLEFANAADDAVRSWTEQVWLKSVSDDDAIERPDQTRLDGFGLAILGVSERIETKK